jgi:GGDEF domain-containing protein
MSGIQFLEAAQSILRNRTAIIIVSGVDYMIEALGALGKGACEILRKPVDLEDLRSSLDHALEQRRTFRDLEAVTRENETLRKRIDDLLRECENLRQQAWQDSLTALPNRHRMGNDLKAFREDALRYRKPFAIAFVDVDKFGCFNKTYGMDAGDAALRHVASTLRKELRAGDVVYRPGKGDEKGPPPPPAGEIEWVFRFAGDEFLLVLNQQDETGASRAADRLRRAVAEQPVRMGESGVEERIKLSIGVVANDPAHPLTIDEMIKEAERRMRVVKGRKPPGNVVEPPPPSPGPCAPRPRATL